MTSAPRNPEETDDEWSRRTEAELAEAAREKAEAPDSDNAKANVNRLMTEGPADIGRQPSGRDRWWLFRKVFWRFR